MLSVGMDSHTDILVSVCLLTYNQDKYIAEAIESALMQQAGFNYEIVISDDCSTDKTRKICETYQQRHPDVIRLLPNAANVGLKKNFVRALTECRGKYIAYLEGDDKWTSPDKLAKQVDVMKRDKGVVLVHTDWIGYDVNSGCYVTHPKFIGECIRETQSGVVCVINEIQCNVRMFRGSTILFKKSDAQLCIDNDQFAYVTSDFPAFDFQLCQDLSVIGRFHYIDEVMMTANLHDSLSNPKNPLRELDFRSKALFAMAYYIDKYSIPEDIKKMWACRQLHYFTRFPFDKGLSEVIPNVLSFIDFVVSVGGVPTFRQRILILLMRCRYFVHLFSFVRKIMGVKDHVLYKLSRYRLLHSPRKSQFTTIYKSGGFGGSLSLSGVGSDLEQTRVIRDELHRVIQKYAIKSMLDVPCGDMYWMQHVDLKGVDYIGADIVDDLARVNNMRFGGEQKKFVVLDIVQDDLPQVDLIFCRDCLIHMKLNDAKLAIQNFKKSGSKWLLTTTYSSRDANAELGMNLFRPLNLQQPPFSLPALVELINENCTFGGGVYLDKSMGLWRIADLP